MFTGLVETTGRVAEKSNRGRSLGLRIVPDRPLQGGKLVLGESIAVDGVCLTVVGSRDGVGFEADASPETVSRSNLGAGMQKGARVHLERALRLGDRLGGHFVTGHVDGLGRLSARTQLDADALEIQISYPPQMAPLLVEKGSIAINGVSLTVNRLGPGPLFTVVLIPETISRTLLGERVVGDALNLEGDILGKYVLRSLQTSGEASAAGGERGTGLDLETLARNGFA